MRTETVQGDGFTMVVRGRTRRTPALESEYLINLKQNHPDMKSLTPDSTVTSAELTTRNPRGWSLIGVASVFRATAARMVSIEFPTGEVHQEPFAPDVLVIAFDAYLESEQLPDQSDVWSKVEATIQRIDKPEMTTDPFLGSGTPKT